MTRSLRLFSIAMALGSLVSCSTAETADGETADKVEQVQPAAVPAPTILPAGTALNVVLKDGVSTEVTTTGSEFTVALAEPVVIDGKTILEKGATATGRVVDVRKPGRVKGRASLSLVLTSVVHNGKTIPIDTNTYVGVAESDKKRDVGIIGGAAGVGAAIGAIADGGKGAATGAAIGGAAGTATVLATPGDNLHYPPETRINFVLAKPATL
jgi:hypothetical protein